MVALATVAELEVRLGVEVGSIEGTDLARLEAVLADVSTLVREVAAPVLDAATPETTPGAVRVIVRQVAYRAYTNPDGYSGENIPGGYGYQVNQTGPVGLYLTEDEVAAILSAVATAGGGRVTVYDTRTPSAYEVPGPARYFWGLE